MSRHRCFHVTPVDRSQLCEFIKETIILFGDFSIHISNTVYIRCICTRPPPPSYPEEKTEVHKISGTNGHGCCDFGP